MRTLAGRLIGLAREANLDTNVLMRDDAPSALGFLTSLLASVLVLGLVDPK